MNCTFNDNGQNIVKWDVSGHGQAKIKVDDEDGITTQTLKF
jgi:hypothetical protein